MSLNQRTDEDHFSAEYTNATTLSLGIRTDGKLSEALDQPEYPSPPTPPPPPLLRTQRNVDLPEVETGVHSYHSCVTHTTNKTRGRPIVGDDVSRLDLGVPAMCAHSVACHGFIPLEDAMPTQTPSEDPMIFPAPLDLTRCFDPNDFGDVGIHHEGCEDALLMHPYYEGRIDADNTGEVVRWEEGVNVDADEETEDDLVWVRC